jgi:CBS domain-containing protein
MTIREVCRRSVATARRAEGLVEIARRMREQHVGCVVVVADGDAGEVPLGILTDRDLVIEVIAQAIPLDSVTVGDIASSDLLVAREDDAIWDTLQRMRIRGVRRAPVVDAAGRLTGIVSADDLLPLVAAEIGALARLSAEQLEQERRSRPAQR